VRPGLGIVTPSGWGLVSALPARGEVWWCTTSKNWSTVALAGVQVLLTSTRRWTGHTCEMNLRPFIAVALTVAPLPPPKSARRIEASTSSRRA
jgi:hypothetical protein